MYKKFFALTDVVGEDQKKKKKVQYTLCDKYMICMMMKNDLKKELRSSGRRLGEGRTRGNLQTQRI